MHCMDTLSYTQNPGVHRCRVARETVLRRRDEEQLVSTRLAQLAALFELNSERLAQLTTLGAEAYRSSSEFARTNLNAADLCAKLTQAVTRTAEQRRNTQALHRQACERLQESLWAFLEAAYGVTRAQTLEATDGPVRFTAMRVSMRQDFQGAYQVHVRGPSVRRVAPDVEPEIVMRAFALEQEVEFEDEAELA